MTSGGGTGPDWKCGGGVEMRRQRLERENSGEGVRSGWREEADGGREERERTRERREREKGSTPDEESSLRSDPRGALDAAAVAVAETVTVTVTSRDD